MFKKLIVVMLCFLVFAGIFAGCAAPQVGAETQ